MGYLILGLALFVILVIAASLMAIAGGQSRLEENRLWRIRHTQKEYEGVPLYWNHQIGWASITMATLYKEIEIDNHNLPTYGKWEPV